MKKIGNHTAAIIAVALAFVLCCGGTGLLAYAAGAKASDAPAASGKDETVYVMTDAAGAVQKVIVSDCLSNADGSAALSDVSSLSDIENVGGDETFTTDASGNIVWAANGSQIVYQGTADKDLPVSLAVSYTLDGKAVTAEQIAGATGKVTMRFDFTNKQYEEREIGGETVKIYVPFMMLTGVILDGSCAQNVTVDNGKLLNDGDRVVVAGYAMPGLRESLGLSDDSGIKIPESVEISFDATDFALDTTLTIASNELFNDLDLENVKDADSLADSMAQFTSAMQQLSNGSSQLYTGLCTLLDKSGALTAGLDQLAANMPMVATLSEGAKQLSSGLSTISGNSAAINAGAKQTFEALLAVADSQLAAAGVTADKLTIENYAKVLNALGAGVTQEDVYKMAYAAAQAKVEPMVRAQAGAIRTQVETGVKAAVLEGVLAAAGVVNQDGSAMTATQYQQYAAMGAISAEQQQAVSAAVTQKMQSEEIQKTITDKTEEQVLAAIAKQMESAEVQAQLTVAVKNAMTGAGPLIALKNSLDQYNTFYQGLQQYTAGVDSAVAGAGQVAAGADSLYNKLGSGVSALQSGGSALVTGVTQLRDGAGDLSSGIAQFSEEGIGKLTAAFGGDLGSLLTRLRAIVDVSKGYTSFSGVSADTAASVKFIFRSDSIG